MKEKKSLDIYLNLTSIIFLIGGDNCFSYGDSDDVEDKDKEEKDDGKYNMGRRKAMMIVIYADF